MNIRYGEIEALMEDLIESTILDIFQSELDSKKEGRAALEILKQKLEDIELDTIDELFD